MSFIAWNSHDLAKDFSFIKEAGFIPSIETNSKSVMMITTSLHAGQPKRHLLTTGWSVFVSAKRLVAGDSVLFIW